MLIPLQTFPGWPAAPDVSILNFLLVLLVIPLGIGLVLALIVLGGTLARRGRGGPVHQKDPVWIGSTASHKAISADATARETGGASVRW